jgi:2'-5' RNA ligase
MKKRIFIAILLSKKIKEDILNWEEKIKNLPIRIIPQENLHLTIIPPWYEDNPEKTAKKIDAISGKFGEIEIKFKKIKLGPNKINPRLIWVEGESPEPLIKLKTELEQILGILPDKKNLKAHITIARFKPFQFKYFSDKKIEENIEWSEKAKELAILESKLLKDGAKYTIIKKIKI